jgi:hypothetical protein
MTNVTASACAVRPSLFSPGDMALDFAAIASSELSDKVTPSLFTAWPPHDFAGMYQRHLGARRAAPLRLLEIGLGCHMPAGPGRSIPIWRRFLPCARVSIIEFEGACAEPYRGELEGLFIGDQSSAAVLDAALANAPYDVVIDDGSHNSAHQISSLMHLFPRLAPGGVYILEDLHCAWDAHCVPTDKPAMLFLAAVTVMKAMRDVRAPMQHNADTASILAWAEPLGAQKLAALADHIDCGQGICAIVRI